MKKKSIGIIVAIAAIVAAIGGTNAAFTTSTTTRHEVSTQDLGIVLHQANLQGEETELKPASATEKDRMELSYQGMPGDVIQEKIWVANTKSESCYVRILVRRSWKDEEGNKQLETMQNDEERALLAEDISLEFDRDNWLIMEDPEDLEVITCYYKYPIAKGEATTSLIRNYSILTENLSMNSNAYAGLSADLNFEADAIQSYDAQNAMLAGWGVNATMENDTILQITEQ